MNDLVCNGHEGRDELGIPTQAGPFSDRDIPIKDKILLLVWRKHLKIQTFKLFDIGIHEQVKQKGIVMKLRIRREIMELKSYGTR